MNDIKEIINDLRQRIYTSFSDLEFVEATHQYFISGEEYRSVSSIIEEFGHPFDSDEKSKSVAKKRGITPEEVLKEWKYTNRKSTVNGSLTHEFLEGNVWLKCGHPELMPEDVRRRNYIESEGWLIPYSAKEEAGQKFLDSLPESMIPIGAEFKMSSKYTGLKTRYAGTTDLLFYFNDNKNPGIVIADWKSNKDIRKDYVRNKGIMMLPPFEDLYDEPLGHYTLQFSMYQIMLESIGLKILGRRLIWLKDDGNYEIIKIQDVTDRLRNIL